MLRCTDLTDGVAVPRSAYDVRCHRLGDESARYWPDCEDNLSPSFLSGLASRRLFRRAAFSMACQEPIVCGSQRLTARG